jgi:hypothetical protein
VDVRQHRGPRAVSDRRSDLAVVSFLVGGVKEPADPSPLPHLLWEWYGQLNGYGWVSALGAGVRLGN